MKMTKLRMILFEREITQKDLYEMIKAQSYVPVPKNTISKIVNGRKTNYHVSTLIKICRALELTPNEIIEKNHYTSLFR